MVEYLNVCRNEPRRFEASASRGGVVRGISLPSPFVCSCKLNLNFPPPLWWRVVSEFSPSHLNPSVDGRRAQNTSGQKMLVRELMHFILFETSVLFPTRRIVSSRRTSSGSKCLDAIVYAGLYLCTLLPRPLLSSQKTVLCLTRKFVSSWKNPFGSK